MSSRTVDLVNSRRLVLLTMFFLLRNAALARLMHTVGTQIFKNVRS